MEFFELINWLNNIESANQDQQALKALADQVSANKENINSLMESAKANSYSNLIFAFLFFILIVGIVLIYYYNMKFEKRTEKRFAELEKLIVAGDKAGQKS